jgi:putative glycosyltransferase
MRLSVVATLYRSEAFLSAFHERASRAARALTPDYEIVLVNDGSPDRSLELAIALHERDPRVRVVDLSRNFGHHRAMMAGLEHARGELVFLIDSDLEEDPALLGAFHDELGRTGADVVYGVQRGRKGGWFERVTGRLFFAAFNRLSPVPMTPNLCTVRLMTRRYVRALVAHRERQFNIGGLWAITGFHQVAVTVDKGARNGTTYSLGRKLLVLVDAVTSFSDRPLVAVFYAGLATSATAAVAATYLIVRRVFFGVLLAGWPSLIVSVWLLGGINLFCIGLIGIYLSKVFIETKQRPYVIVRRLYERECGGDERV